MKPQESNSKPLSNFKRDSPGTRGHCLRCSRDILARDRQPRACGHAPRLAASVQNCEQRLTKHPKHRGSSIACCVYKCSIPDDERRSVCAQTKVPGVPVAQDARQYPMYTNLIHNWRKGARFAPKPESAEPIATVAFLQLRSKGRSLLHW